MNEVEESLGRVAESKGRVGNGHREGQEEFHS